MFGKWKGDVPFQLGEFSGFQLLIFQGVLQIANHQQQRWSPTGPGEYGLADGNFESVISSFSRKVTKMFLLHARFRRCFFWPKPEAISWRKKSNTTSFLAPFRSKSGLDSFPQIWDHCVNGQLGVPPIMYLIMVFVVLSSFFLIIIHKYLLYRAFFMDFP